MERAKSVVCLTGSPTLAACIAEIERLQEQMHVLGVCQTCAERDGLTHEPCPAPEDAARWKRGGDPVGTSLQGTIDVPFSKLVAIFGEPSTHVDHYKVAFEWVITFADGTVATIYDYKASSLYDHDNPTPAQMRAADYSDWHIGGMRDTNVVAKVIEEIKQHALTPGDAQS